MAVRLKYPNGTYVPNTMRLNEEGLLNYEGVCNISEAMEWDNRHIAQRAIWTIEDNIGIVCEMDED